MAQHLIYKVEFFEGGEWVEIPLWRNPFEDTHTLDESLDSAVLTLCEIERDEVFEPFTVCRLTETQDGQPTKTEYYVVGDSQKELVRYSNPKKYNHKINLLEYTKVLERVDIDTLTFRRKLSREYALLSTEASGDFLAKPSTSTVARTVYPETAFGGKFRVPKPNNKAFDVVAIYLKYGYDNVAPSVQYNTDIHIITPSGIDTKIYSLTASSSEGVVVFSDVGGEVCTTYTPTELGTYTLYYVDTYSSSWKWGLTFDVKAPDFVPEQPTWNCYEVCQKILSCGELRQKGIDFQKFWLLPSVADKLKEITAPEFPIIQNTLFEGLSTVGKYIHAIPRATYNDHTRDAELKAYYGSEYKDAEVLGFIDFDFLGGDTVATIPTTAQLIAETENSYIDECCTEIDSTVSNLVCSKDGSESTVIYPWRLGWQSVRSSVGAVKIDNDTAIFGHFTDGIYRPIKLLLYWGDNPEWDGMNETDFVDATPYLYEKTEYDALSRYKGEVYPNTIAYALWWEQSGTYIGGLCEKIESATTYEQPWQRKAIINILRILYPSKDIKDTDDLVGNLYFRLEYIPIMSARVKQRKPTFDGKQGNSLIYQQATSLTETEYFGENMRGAIARMGEPTLMLTYNFAKIDDIPTVGEVVEISRKNGTTDKMYVSLVSRQFRPMCLTATLTLAKNFNRLGSYFAIDSEYRVADVSQDQSTCRFSNYSTDLIFGEKTSTKKESRNGIIEEFSTTLDVGEMPIKVAMLKGYDKDSVEVVRAYTTVSGFALGSSVCYNIHTPNNYGIGYQSNDSGQSDSVRVQRQVPYGDEYGDIKYLDIEYSQGLAKENFLLYRKQIPNLYPEALDDASGTSSKNFKAVFGGTFDYQKNSGEQINLTWQVHFRKNRDTIIIGKGLAKYYPRVRQKDYVNSSGAIQGKFPTVYFFPRELNDLTTLTASDIATAYKGNFARIDATEYCFPKIQYKGEFVAKSWAIINPETYEIFIGENGTIEPNGYTKAIYF